MAEDKRKHSEVGPLGDQVAKNLARLRSERRKTTAQLASEVSELGVTMTPSTVTKIEKQGRRVTTHELVALAAALEVSPVTLMLPAEDPGEPVQVTGNLSQPWAAVWRWMHGEVPLPGSEASRTWESRNRWHFDNRPYTRLTITEIERLLDIRDKGIGPFRVEAEYDGSADPIKAEMTQSAWKEDGHGPGS